MAPIFPFLSRACSRWRVLSLARQYLLAGSIVLIAGMAAIGLWVTGQITKSVTQNTATATALYVDSVIAPLLPNIDGNSVLSDGARRALDETLSHGTLQERLVNFKLWGRDGLITYSSEPSLNGRRFEPTESLKRAWQGAVTAEYDDLEDEEDATERDADVPLLEIYNPIRIPWSGEVIAVAEFYERAEELRDSLFEARVRSWIVVAATTLAMMSALFGIVLRGSGTIARQKEALEQQVTDLRRILRENEELGGRLREASSRLAAVNERALRQLSADLHDGPAQFLALASLRLGSPVLSAADSRGAAELAEIRLVLDEAMQDIRNICRGLALPTIETLDLADLLRSAARAHERRTGTTVALVADPGLPALSPAEKISVYRFVQEGLNNAFRHAEGREQTVTAMMEADELCIRVCDGGPGAEHGTLVPGLGLTGLKDRIESLGGSFEAESSATGTRLAMRLAARKELAA